MAILQLNLLCFSSFFGRKKEVPEPPSPLNPPLYVSTLDRTNIIEFTGLLRGIWEGGVLFGTQNFPEVAHRSAEKFWAVKLQPTPPNFEHSPVPMIFKIHMYTCIRNFRKQKY